MQPEEARRRQRLQEQFHSLQATIASTATYLHRPWEDIDIDLALASELPPSPRPRSTHRDRDHEGVDPLGPGPEGEGSDELGWIDGEESVGCVTDDDRGNAAAASSVQLAEYVAGMTKRVRFYVHRSCIVSCLPFLHAHMQTFSQIHLPTLMHTVADHTNCCGELDETTLSYPPTNTP